MAGTNEKYYTTSHFETIELDSIPLTLNGKIDKKALPVPEIVIGEDYIAPENNIENKLTEIWSELLGLQKEKISSNANFFEIGGNSLTTISLLSRINLNFDITLNFSQLISNPILSEIAKTISTILSLRNTEVDDEEREEFEI